MYMDLAETVASPSTSEVPLIRGLIRRREFTEALLAGEALLAAAPGERDALLFVAMAQRYLGRISDALSTLAILAQHHPRFSRLHEERGHCFLALKQAPEAIQAFLLAVNLNYALPARWSILEGPYHMSGQAGNEPKVPSHVVTPPNLPRATVTT